MHQRMLGKTGFQVSSITLGGGGIGMVWGLPRRKNVSRP